MRSREVAGSAARDDGGFALVAVVFVVALLGVIAVTSLATTSDDRLASVGVRQRTQAFYAAEAGLGEVMARWDSLRYDTLMAAPGDSVDLGWWGLVESRASYRAMIHRVDDGSGNVFNLVVEGRAPGGEGGRQTLAVQLRGGTPPTYGVFARRGLRSSGNGDIFGSVGTNGNIGLTGGSFVFGDATAGGTVATPSRVTGTSTSGAAFVSLPDTPCPTGGYGPAPTGTGVSFTPGSGVLELTGAGAKTFATGSYFFHTILKDGVGQIELAPGAQVEIYVDSWIQWEGDGSNNPGGDPSDLRLYGCNGNSSTWSMIGVADSWVSVYAPRVTLSLEGGGHRYGQFIVGALNHQHDGHLYPDTTFALFSFSGGFAKVPGSWVQLYF